MCNSYQTSLFEQLMELVQSNKAFYFKDQEFKSINDDGTQIVQFYRIFNYRMASYTSFCAPGALECRGIMFQIDTQNERGAATPVRLSSHPMEKFFNLNENPLTTGLDLSKVDLVEDKADGSLISTFICSATGEVHLKSKASLASVQVQEATKWLSQTERSLFKKELRRLASLDYTINMEWVSPDNKIVLRYASDDLRVLTVRSNADGTYLDLDDLPDWAVQLKQQWVTRIERVEDPAEFVASICDMEQVEGFVVRLSDTGMRVKIKTNWYLALHRTKDSVSNPSHLFRAVLEETTDDMKAAFFEDGEALQKIAVMEFLLQAKYRELEELVETFYEQNKHLSRKEYAVLANQTILVKSDLGLLMKRYSGCDVSYKDHLLMKEKMLLECWKNEDLI